MKSLFGFTKGLLRFTKRLFRYIHDLFLILKFEKKKDFFILLIFDPEPEEVVFLWSIYYLINILYKNIKNQNI